MDVPFRKVGSTSQRRRDTGPPDAEAWLTIVTGVKRCVEIVHWCVKTEAPYSAANYGYYASHSRFFWGLRLHLITTPSGLPVAYALAGAKIDERDTALHMIAFDTELHRGGQALTGDKGYDAPTSKPS